MSFSGSTMGRYSRVMLWITGGILLAMGAVFVVALGSIPFAGGAMLLTGAILGITGLVLIIIGFIVGRRAANVDRVLATGLAGTAQVTGVTQTGMYLNENPQVALNLLVTVPGRPAFTATHKSFVPLILLGRLTSGQPLAVKVDPVDMSKVVIDWQNAGFGGGFQMPGTMAMPDAAGGSTGVNESLSQVQAALASVGAPSPYATPEQGAYTVEQLREWLRQNGVAGTARIDKATDTGKIVGDERLYTMVLTLEMPGKPAQTLPESAAMVPLTAMHKVRVGASVPVRVAADNPNLTMFEWDKL